MPTKEQRCPNCKRHLVTVLEQSRNRCNACYRPETVSNAEELVFRGLEAARKLNGAQWELGDLANEWMLGRQGNTDESLRDYAGRIGVDYDSLRHYRRVANAFPAVKRFTTLSFGHHQVIATREDSPDWLKAASEQGWSVRQMLEAIHVSDAQKALEAISEAVGQITGADLDDNSTEDPDAELLTAMETPVPVPAWDDGSGDVTLDALADAAQYSQNDPIEPLHRLERMAQDIVDLWPTRDIIPRIMAIHGPQPIEYHARALTPIIDYLLELREILQGYLATR